MPSTDDAGLAEVPVDSHTIYEGRILNLRVDDVVMPDGTKAVREVVEHTAAVAVVALLPGDRTLLVRQHRYPVAETLLELPAGLVDEGEDPVQAGARELAEETGYAPGLIEPMLSFYSSPGFTDEELHIYLARDLRPTVASPDEDEFIEPVVVDWQEAVDMCLDGRIRDAKTITGLLAVARALST